MKIPHWPFLFGSWISLGVGFLMNKIVMAFNNGQMPVLIPGGCDNTDELAGDLIHSCMTHATHLKFLADWGMLNGVGIASPGDFFLWAGQNTWQFGLIIWLTLMIKEHNDLSRS